MTTTEGGTTVIDGFLIEKNDEVLGLEMTKTEGGTTVIDGFLIEEDDEVLGLERLLTRVRVKLERASYFDASTTTHVEKGLLFNLEWKWNKDDSYKICNIPEEEINQISLAVWMGKKLYSYSLYIEYALRAFRTSLTNAHIGDIVCLPTIKCRKISVFL